MNNLNTHYNSSIGLGNKALYTTINNRNNNTYAPSLNQQTRYFSGVDAEIYFGDTFIDETVNINFTLQQNTLPIYGYNSYVFDACAQGSRLIQGSFTVNFTKSNYLYEVLDTLSVVNSGATLSKRSHACNNKTMSKNSRTPLWDKCFDIALSYGNYKELVNNSYNAQDNTLVDLSTMVVLRGVYLIGCEQDFGTSQQGGKNTGTGGIPIYETYYFYARDIEYETVGTQEETKPITVVDTEIDDILLEKHEPLTIVSCEMTHNPDNSYQIDMEISYDADVINMDNRGMIEVVMDLRSKYSFILFENEDKKEITNEDNNIHHSFYQCIISKDRTDIINQLRYYGNTKIGSDIKIYYTDISDESNPMYTFEKFTNRKITIPRV